MVKPNPRPTEPWPRWPTVAFEKGHALRMSLPAPVGGVGEFNNKKNTPPAEARKNK